MDITKLQLDRFICGDDESVAQRALSKMLENENIGISYADMMRYRVSNRAKDLCIDTYYVAHDGDHAYSRLWNGWGRHENAIGNFGNFVTVETLRGKGLGHRMLEFWLDDITSRNDLPLCFLCMGDKRAAKLYFPYGFTTIEDGAEWGPLFAPLGDSPKDFREFCADYYRPSKLLFRAPATIEWRHEIDCLLKYSLWSMGGDWRIAGKTLEEALLYFPHRAELIFSEDSRPVGWIFDGESRIHPSYASSEIVNR